jgi:Flp pilus assembly protein CpaB
VRTRYVIIGSIVVAVVTAATIFVILDRPQPEETPIADGELVTVIVSKQAIPANKLLDSLIEDGYFEEISVPRDALVEGAVTDIGDLRGMRTTTTIYATEQISTLRLVPDG